MGANEYRYPLLFVIGALAASYVVIEISKYIENHLLMMDKILSFWTKKYIYFNMAVCGIPLGNCGTVI